jgi:predicted nucleic acid-binding Zn finger protein
MLQQVGGVFVHQVVGHRDDYILERMFLKSRGTIYRVPTVGWVSCHWMIPLKNGNHQAKS